MDYTKNIDYKILGSIWFGKIGIVAVDNNGFGWKVYIGLGLGFGNNQKDDEQFIAANGFPVGKSIALASFPELKPYEFRS
jgi:hypothetical protein